MEVQLQKNYKKSVETYTKLLKNKNNSTDETVLALFHRLECFFELNNYTAVINDCNKIIQITKNKDLHTTRLARKKLIHSLFLLQNYIDADRAAKEWLTLLEIEESIEVNEVKLILHGLLRTFNSNTASKQKFCNLMKLLDVHLAKMSDNINGTITNNMDSLIKEICIYCNLSFRDKNELRMHCHTELHEMIIMSDEGRDWKWRPPPRGFKCDTYILCQNFKDTKSCRYGIQCVQAHGEEEFNEWKERFRYREMKLQRAREKELFGKSYTEELLEKWIQSPNPDNLMCDRIEEVEDSCSCPLSVPVSSKNSCHHWIFSIKTRKPLKAIALLQDTYRTHFSIANFYIENVLVDLKNDQEWISTLTVQNPFRVIEYKINVKFKTSIFGTFRQSIVFDFSEDSVLVRHLCADLVPENQLHKINEIRQEITLSIAERWTRKNSEIEQFHSDLVSASSTNDKWENKIRSMYPCPEAESFLLSQSTLLDKKFTKNNYRDRMHELLFLEEIARYDLIAKYNLTTKLQITSSYILSPNSMAASTAKYSNNGELFASVALGRELSEDTSEGRLILMHCNTVYLSIIEIANKKIYEALIEDKGKDTIYLRLSSKTVEELGLSPDSDIKVQIQFQLNRIPYCEWHYILDKITNFKPIFPETYLEPVIPWSPSRQWSKNLDSRLNVKQKEAVVAITTPLNIPLPPILVIGPFGTGKTFTLAQAIKNLIKDEKNRILLCTHSNSAADLYIKDYLDKWVTEEGDKNATPLRIYYQKRWVVTVNSIVQKYCLIDDHNGNRSFRIPSLTDLEKHRIIVVTLSTSVYLSAMGLSQGFFTHILLDEAAQAIECETVTPLAIANERTRLVLAGDHMQIGPDIFSSLAKESNLHISLLERLYDYYPKEFPCKILLCENYRAHESIIQFTSESFYDQKLISSSKQPRHNRYYPLSFFTTRGEDVQDKNSTAYYNNSEVYEVVERVAELKRNWSDDEWGNFNDQSIGVVTPYADQVFRIRAELRKRRIDNVAVERVLNVQGKQFRAIILSTVRTRKTCTNDTKDSIDYGFMSNSKLLNTAITRAQSLVAVVGDPIALCSVGRCSKVWERFIQICNENESLYGITWTQLKLQLDSIELKKIYTLNPLAPEFIPRYYLKEQQQQQQQQQQQHQQQQRQQLQQASQIPTITLPSSLLGPRHHVTVPTPMISPYSLAFPPLLYQAPQTRPIIFNPLSTIPVRTFNPPIRVMNHIVLTAQPPPPPQSAPAPAPVVVPRTLVSCATTTATIIPKHSPTFIKSATASPNNNNNGAPEKMIQFMNNVHFPEAHIMNDCINLLPHNMSLADMLLQPKGMQEKWYNYLKATSGLIAAEKFRYLLHTTNMKGSKIPDRLFFDSQHQQYTTLHIQSHSSSSSSDSPNFNWYDSPTSQINLNKPVYIQNNYSQPLLPQQVSSSSSSSVNIINKNNDKNVEMIKPPSSSSSIMIEKPKVSSSSSAVINPIINNVPINNKPPSLFLLDDTKSKIVNSMLEIDENDLEKHLHKEFAKLELKETVKNGTTTDVPRFYKYFKEC